MYRLITESILGLQLVVDRLYFVPCIPMDWTSFVMHYRYRETFYHIKVLKPESGQSVRRVTIDGVVQSELFIPLHDDRQNHQVEIELG